MSRAIDDETWKRLNALADGELGGDVRAGLERRLAREPALAAALSEIRTLKRAVADTAPWSLGDDGPSAPGAARAPGTSPASIFGESLRAAPRRPVVPLAAAMLGALVLGVVLVARDGASGDAPDVADALAPAPLAAPDAAPNAAPAATLVAALPDALHAALREPVAADVVAAPPAEPDGSRTFAGHRFPDLASHGVRAARALTRETPAGAVAATLYLGPEGCDFTLGAAPDSLAALLPGAAGAPASADRGASAGASRRTEALTAGFARAALVRAWQVGETVWVASSDAIDPERFAALADLAAERTAAASEADTVVHVARADDSAERTSCAAG